MSVRDKVIKKGGGASSGARPRLTTRQKLRLLVPFFASVFATVAVVSFAKAVFTAKPSQIASDGPQEDGRRAGWLGLDLSRLPRGPEWLVAALGDVLAAVGGSPAQADYTGRPVIGRIGEFELQPSRMRPIAVDQRSAEPTTVAEARPADGKKPAAATRSKPAPAAAAKSATRPAAPADDGRGARFATLGKPVAAAPAMAVRLAPAEAVLAETLRLARVDFRYADRAAEAYQQFVAVTPDAFTRESYKSQLDEVANLKAAATRERSRFDLFTDKFLTPSPDGREKDLATCLRKIDVVQTATVARKAVTIHPNVYAWFALIEAPVADKERDDVKRSVLTCLEPFDGEGSISLMLNSNVPNPESMRAAMASVATPFAMLRRAEAKAEPRQNRPIQ